MSIRRRLFLSNLLMIVIPVVLCALLAYTILFAFSGRSDKPMEQAYPTAFRLISHFQEKEDLEALLAEAQAFNEQFADRSVFVAVAHQGVFLYPEDVPQLLAGHKAMLPLILEDGITGNLGMNNLRIVVHQSGSYRIVLVDLQHRLGDGDFFGRPMVYQAPLLFGALIVIVLLTNRLLTHLLTRSITVPLGLLVDGVHQLRDGNLSYRIAYHRRDEFAAVCEDFNDMAGYLQEMIARQQKDEQSRKELLAGISHDLRTPLTSIKAYVEGLLDGIAEDLPTQLKYLGTIRQKAEDIDRLVDKLFLFSKLEMDEYPFRNERLDAPELLEELVAATGEEYARRGLQITLGELPRNAFVRSDPVQLHSALVNILENSVLYKEKDRGHILVECVSREAAVDLVLTDDGPGVPAESLPRLFDAFYRSDPSRQNPNKGSGLGLAITRRAVEQMGGSIRAEAPPGGGLRVVITLPKEPEDEEDTHH